MLVYIVCVYNINGVLLIASVILSRRKYMVMNTRMIDGAALQVVSVICLLSIIDSSVIVRKKLVMNSYKSVYRLGSSLASNTF